MREPGPVARLCAKFGGAKRFQAELAKVGHANELEGRAPPAPAPAPTQKPEEPEQNHTPAEPEQNHTPAEPEQEPVPI